MPPSTITAKLLIFVGCSGCLLDSTRALESASRPFTLDLGYAFNDLDHDMMRDEWEDLFLLDKSIDDSALDLDLDGLNNLQEYLAGTNPRVSELGLRSGISTAFSLFLSSPVPDADSDQLPDFWEERYSGSTIGLAPGDDPDGDQRNNIDEYNGGWNPLLSDTSGLSSHASERYLLDTGAYPAGFTADSDGDDMPDWWEVRYGLDPGVDDAMADADSDGISNVIEYRLGLYPDRVDALASKSNAESLAFMVNTLSLRRDSDADSIPDWWEISYGLDPFKSDAVDDPDLDGRTNLEEYNAGSHPLVIDWTGDDTRASGPFLLDTGAFPLGYTTDTDGDGMPDWWEIKYGLNPEADDAAQDPDSDFIPNLSEYLSGLNPNANDLFWVSDASGNVFTLDTDALMVDGDQDGIPDWQSSDFVMITTKNASMSDKVDSSALTEAVSPSITRQDPDRLTLISAPEENPLEWIITWNTEPGYLYNLYFSESLTDRWPTTAIYSVWGDGSPKRYTNRAEISETRFFRIESIAP